MQDKEEVILVLLSLDVVVVVVVVAVYLMERKIPMSVIPVRMVDGTVVATGTGTVPAASVSATAVALSWADHGVIGVADDDTDGNDHYSQYS